MCRSVSVTSRRVLAALLLLCSVLILGCGSGEKPRLYIYCNETFWYVMQEEALFFNKIYGFDITLIPIRAPHTTHLAEETEGTGTGSLTPSPWRSMPKEDSQSTPDAADTINIEIDQQIERIAVESFGDLFVSDSHKQIEKLQKLALTVDEFPVCYLTLTMLVPKGNPHQLHSVKEVLDTNRVIGIIDSSLDGLGECSWNMLGNIVPGGKSAIPKAQIRMFERQYDLLEAIEQRRVDAALVWNSTSLVNYLLVKYSETYNAENEAIMREAERQNDPDKLRVILRSMYQHLIENNNFAETVTLKDNPGEFCVIKVPLIALSSTSRYGYCERFADFMRSELGKETLRRFGFVTP